MDAALASSLAAILGFILNIVQLLVIASVIVSWVGDPNSSIVQMINSVTEPMYRPFRKLTRNLPGPIDWAPMVVLLLVIAIDRGVVAYLNAYARSGGM